jgi:lipopolysaccharide assembly outer membrane protein LptD (OstA)
LKRLALISCVAVLAIAQTPVHHGDVMISADRAERTGAVRHLAGHVTIETDAVTLRADEADLNDDTGEILAHGDVRVKLK